jgi:hypothetical protein
MSRRYVSLLICMHFTIRGIKTKVHRKCQEAKRSSEEIYPPAVGHFILFFQWYNIALIIRYFQVKMLISFIICPYFAFYDFFILFIHIFN